MWLELSEHGVKEVASAVESAYRAGQRNTLVLALAGFLGKQGVGLRSCLRVVEELHKRCRDEDPLSERFAAAVYTYRKLRYPVERERWRAERWAGRRVCGFAKGGEEEVVGFTVLWKLLCDARGEGGARESLEKIKKAIAEARKEVEAESLEKFLR